MNANSEREWCTGARSIPAPLHQASQPSLKELARALAPATGAAEQKDHRNAGASGADGARGAAGASPIAQRLLAIAAQLGIPREIVDQLPPDELQAAAAQAAACEEHKDGKGDPLAQSLLVFWLRALADRSESFPIRQRALANPQHGSP